MSGTSDVVERFPEARWKVMRFEDGHGRALEHATHNRRDPETVNVPEGYVFVGERPLWESDQKL